MIQMKKFLLMVTQSMVILSIFYLIASVGAVLLDWLLADYTRLIAFMIVMLYTTGKFMYKEML